MQYVLWTDGRGVSFVWLPVTVRTGMDKPSCVFEKNLLNYFFFNVCKYKQIQEEQENYNNTAEIY